MVSRAAGRQRENQLLTVKAVHLFIRVFFMYSDFDHRGKPNYQN